MNKSNQSQKPSTETVKVTVEVEKPLADFVSHYLSFAGIDATFAERIGRSIR